MLVQGTPLHQWGLKYVMKLLVIKYRVISDPALCKPLYPGYMPGSPSNIMPSVEPLS